MPGARVKRRRGRWLIAVLAFPLIALAAGAAEHDGAIAPTSYEPVGIYPEGTSPAVVADDDARPVEVGTKFAVTVPGRVIGVRFYKSARNTGTHVASLWSPGGQRLASARPASETRSGWQTVSFAKPVAIDPGKAFVASYHTDTGHYSILEGAYANGSIGNATVRGLAGVYRYGPSGFPRSTWHQSDYYVEPVFLPAASTGATPSPTSAPSTSVPSTPAAPSTGTSSTSAPSTPVAPSTSASSSPVAPSTSASSSTPASPSPTAPSSAPSVGSGWPNADNTGAKGTLTPIAGRTITTDGTTLENVLVNGQLTIRASNVTLRNVHVKTDSYFGVLDYGKNLLIEDATIEGRVGTTVGLAAFDSGQFVARRLNVFNSEDGVRLASGSKLYDSFVHDLIGTSESHYDSVTADGDTGWEIVHNTILNDHSWTACVWIGDPRYAPSEGSLKNNYIAGGGYMIYAGPSTGAGLRVVDNVFSTKYFPKGGYWGTTYKWDPAGNTWSGNTWIDGSQAGQPAGP